MAAVWFQSACLLFVTVVVVSFGQFVAASDELGAFTVTVGVELSCPSCASGLERRLGRLDNVAVVEIQVVEEQVVLGATSGTKIDLREVRDVIRNAGFVPSRVHLTVVGLVVRLNDGIGITLSEDAVVMVAVVDAKRSALLSQALGHMVAVSGTVPLEDGGEEILYLSEVEIQK